MTKTNRRLIVTGGFVLIGTGANFLARTTNVCIFALFESTSLFTYFGVLIGFALTIYTFGLSMLDGIKQKVNTHTTLTPQNKIDINAKLVAGFHQIKEDIWFIFYSILFVIMFAVLKEVVNPFGWKVEYLKLPETINLTLFLMTTLAMWDIMKALFNLSEINFSL